MTTEKNDAPSAERWEEVHEWLTQMFARVRREARAEAFEEMRAEFQVNDMNRSAELCEALAAKERAK